MSDFVMTIGGDTVPAAESFGVVNPATGEVFAEAPECSREQLDAAFDAASKAQRDWKSDEAVRRATLLKMADVLLASGAEIAPVLTSEQGKPLADANIEVFAAGHLVPVLRQPRDPAPGHPGRRRGPGGGGPAPDRRGGRHHPVELPADPGLLEDRPGPAGRQHAGAQAVPVHPAVHPQDHRAPARRGAPGRAQRGQRRRRARRLDDRPPGAPQGQLHRVDRDGQEGGHLGRPRPQAGHLGAGRQRPGHRAGRRRPVRGGQGHLRRGVQQQRPGVLGHQAGLRARVPLRPGGRRPGRPGRQGQGGRRDRARRQARPHQQRPAVRAGQGAGRRRPLPRGHARPRAERPWTGRATSSSPPSSPT